MRNLKNQKEIYNIVENVTPLSHKLIVYRGVSSIRVYYQCVLYEDIDGTEVPVDKAKLIANKLDGIGISKFNIIYEQQPILTTEEQETQDQAQQQQ